MILRQSRLRLTQAIYYGQPPVIGGAGTVTSVAAGTGITLAPNPIIGAGTVSLAVPVTVPNGGTGAITLSGQLRGNGAGAITGGSQTSLATEVTGTLGVGNGGTGVGTITGLIRGNGGAAFTGGAQASLTTEVSGILPYANGGTNANTAWTQGSIPFAGATSFEQDNANLFFDNTNNRLGVGTATPNSALEVNGDVEIKNGSGGVLKFQDGTSQASAAAGGGTVNGTGTATNLAFWTAGSTISSDNALYWDNASKRLGVGTNTPGVLGDFVAAGDSVVGVRRTGATTSDVTVTAASGLGKVGSVLNNVPVAIVVNNAEISRFTGTGLGVLKTPAVPLDVNGNAAVKDTLTFNGSVSGAVALKAQAAAGAATFQLPAADGAAGQFLKTDGAGVLAFDTPAGAGTVTTNGVISSGMVMFNDPLGPTVITGEGNLFWDNPNNRLGIQTSSPVTPLQVGGAVGAPVLSSQILANVNAPSYITARNTLSSTEATFGADASGGHLSTQSNSPLLVKTNNLLAATVDTSQRLVVTNSLGIGMTPTRSLDVINSGFARAKVQDYGGQVFNVMSYGAVGDGATDDTAAINLALTAAQAVTPAGTVLFPGGHYWKTTGNHQITVSGLCIRGEGSGTTTIKLEHATNDLFVIAGTSTKDDITIAGFRVDSTITRTAGWTIKFAPVYNAGFLLRRSHIEDIVMTAQCNGIWIACYEYDWIDRCLVDYPSVTGVTGGIGFKIGQTAVTNVGQGAEIYLRGCQANSRTFPALSYGFWMEDCDAVYLLQCGSIANLNAFVVTNTAHACANFFWSQIVSDGTTASATTNHSTWIKGTLQNTSFIITGSWFCAAGRGAGVQVGQDGLHIDKGTVFTVSGCMFWNDVRYGLYTTDTQGSFTGNTFGANGTAGFYVNSTNIGNLLGHYASNTSLNAVNSWATSALSARCGFIGNYYFTAPAYGVAPGANLNNVTY